MLKVICPYCGNLAELIDSKEIYKGRSYGFIWICRPCDAYVGTHKDSKNHQPLGKLANRELREWRKKAHKLFDMLWMSREKTRKEAYQILCKKMRMTKDQAHIGQFDIEECKKLIKLFSSPS